MEVVAKVEVPLTWNLCAPRFTSDVPPVYGMKVDETHEVEAKVFDAYANVGKVAVA